LRNTGVTTRRIKKIYIYTVSNSIIELRGTYSTIVRQQSYIWDQFNYRTYTAYLFVIIVYQYKLYRLFFFFNYNKSMHLYNYIKKMLLFFIAKDKCSGLCLG